MASQYKDHIRTVYVSRGFLQNLDPRDWPLTISGSKRWEVKGWRQQFKELHNLRSLPNILRVPDRSEGDAGERK
jgi:hypothetical protein